MDFSDPSGISLPQHAIIPFLNHLLDGNVYKKFSDFHIFSFWFKSQFYHEQ